MKKFSMAWLFAALVLTVFPSAAAAQQRETYTGTIISFGSGRDTRTRTGTFTLTINGYTSDERAQRLLDRLREGGQDSLRRAIDDEDLGRFSVGPNVGVPINVVRQSVVDGQRRLFIVFERWMQFAELRGGYRSVDYPFGVIELFIDERTGRGEGTYIAAARIRWDYDSKNRQFQVEIENFATFPARMLGVSRTNRPR